jgi:hypothetical protein
MNFHLKSLLNDVTNTTVAESEGSTLQVPKSAIGHDPEPLSSTSDL